VEATDTRSSAPRPRWRPGSIGVAILLFIVYVAAGKLGLRFALDNPSASSVWPPTGIALAAVLLWGYRVLPAVFMGAFVVNWTTAGTFATSAGIAAGNTLEAALGALLVNRFANGLQAFADPQGVLRFTTLGALVATSVSASIGVGTLVLGGMLDPSRFGSVWLTWRLGDAAGALLITPLLVLWAQPLRGSGTRRAPELVLLVASLGLVVGAVFTGALPSGLGYVGGSVLVWAAFRFGQRVTTLATLVWCAVALAGTLHGYGPFVRPSQAESLFLLQAYMGVLAVTTLAMSSAVKQRRLLSQRLEAEVIDRTRDLSSANERLRREAAERRDLEAERERFVEERAARREAERLNRQKDEFLATVSHELRTPLAAVLGWAELLRRSAVDDMSKDKAIDAILRNARLQVRLVSDMLDVSRIITRGRLDLNLQIVDPAAVVHATLEQLLPTADARRIRIWIPPQTSAGPLLGDPDRLGQAIGNVVGNAIKFSPEDGEIEVSFRQHNGIEIKVADRGPGIDPRFLPSLFDRFSQEDRSSTRRHGGLGLGLSIAKHIIELHGGTITAANRPEGGALFTIQLPESSAESGLLAVAPSARSEPASRDGLEPTLLRGRVVLVVDDEASSREITAAVLERCGAEVLTASSTAEGLDLLGARTPDAMVVDLAMPDQDGYHFLDRARRGSRHAPALALTAHANASEETKARHAGFDAFLSKPVDPIVLARTVSSIVRRDATGPAANSADAS